MDRLSDRFKHRPRAPRESKLQILPSLAQSANGGQKPVKEGAGADPVPCAPLPQPGEIDVRMSVGGGAGFRSRKVGCRPRLSLRT